MIHYIIYSMLILVTYIAFKIFKPIYTCLILKAKHKPYIQTQCYPLLGQFYYENLSYKKYKDSHTIRRNILKDHPSTKMILTNIGTNVVLWVITCPVIAKEFL